VKEEVKAGIIIVTSLLLLCGSVIVISGTSFFEKTDRYVVKVTNAAGLEAGSQVRLGGVRVGRVTSIREPSKPGEPVTIEIGVRAGMPIYKGTKALITQIGFVGDIYLLLSVEKTTDERLMAGSEIPTEDTPDFGRIMARLDGLSQNVDKLVTDIDRLFSPRNIASIEALVKDTNHAIVSGSSNFEKVAVSMKSTTDKLQLVLNEVEDLVKTNKAGVAGLIEKARDDLEKAGQMIQSIDEAAKKADKVAGSAGAAVELQSKNITLLLRRVTETAEEIRDLVREVQRKPWSFIYQEKKDD
jgi:ABC-type transporter Mla subunit MlaD